jgi:hypothetical protein
VLSSFQGIIFFLKNMMKYSMIYFVAGKSQNVKSSY